MNPINIDTRKLAMRVGAAHDAFTDNCHRPMTHDAIRATAAWNATCRMLSSVMGIGNTEVHVRLAVQYALREFYAERPFSPTRGREAAEAWMAARTEVILGVLNGLNTSGASNR